MMREREKERKREREKERKREREKERKREREKERKSKYVGILQLHSTQCPHPLHG